MPAVKGLRDRLRDNEDIIVAEGYLFEFERRGWLKAGAFVPEVVIENPELVRQVHREFVRAGSDVVLAFTYYGHREKLRMIGKEDLLETLNIKALRIAREVADETNTLMAGNICNTTLYQSDDPESIAKTEAIFKEQIEWAVQEKADFIVGETFSELGEAMLALECIKKYGNGLPSVVTLVAHAKDETLEGVEFHVACKKLEDAGADVVGINCGRGPATISPLMTDIRKACQGPIAAVPVPYRTCTEFPIFQSFKDPTTGVRAFPVDLPAHACGRTEIRQWAADMKQLGVQYIGLCCGNAAHYVREVAEAYGRRPEASKFSPDMSQHYVYGNRDFCKSYYTQGLRSHLE